MGQSAAHLTPWILTVTAGTFLYVALADMVRGQPGMGAAGPGHVPALLSPRSAPSSPRCCGVLARAPGATSSCRTRGSCWAAASCWASPWPKATSVPGCSPDRGGVWPRSPPPRQLEKRGRAGRTLKRTPRTGLSPLHVRPTVPQPGSLQSRNAWKLTWGVSRHGAASPQPLGPTGRRWGGSALPHSPSWGLGCPARGGPEVLGPRLRWWGRGRARSPTPSSLVQPVPEEGRQERGNRSNSILINIIDSKPQYE